MKTFQVATALLAGLAAATPAPSTNNAVNQPLDERQILGPTGDVIACYAIDIFGKGLANSTIPFGSAIGGFLESIASDLCAAGGATPPKGKRDEFISVDQLLREREVDSELAAHAGNFIQIFGSALNVDGIPNGANVSSFLTQLGQDLAAANSTS